MARTGCAPRGDRDPWTPRWVTVDPGGCTVAGVPGSHQPDREALRAALGVFLLDGEPAPGAAAPGTGGRGTDPLLVWLGGRRDPGWFAAAVRARTAGADPWAAAVYLTGAAHLVGSHGGGPCLDAVGRLAADHLDRFPQRPRPDRPRWSVWDDPEPGLARRWEDRRVDHTLVALGGNPGGSHRDLLTPGGRALVGHLGPGGALRTAGPAGVFRLRARRTGGRDLLVRDGSRWRILHNPADWGPGVCSTVFDALVTDRHPGVGDPGDPSPLRGARKPDALVELAGAAAFVNPVARRWLGEVPLWRVPVVHRDGIVLAALGAGRRPVRPGGPGPRTPVRPGGLWRPWVLRDLQLAARRGPGVFWDRLAVWWRAAVAGAVAADGPRR